MLLGILCNCMCCIGMISTLDCGLSHTDMTLAGWPGPLCCVLEQDAYSHSASPLRSKNGYGQTVHSTRQNAGGEGGGNLYCDGLASYPGGRRSAQYSKLLHVTEIGISSSSIGQFGPSATWPCGHFLSKKSLKCSCWWNQLKCYYTPDCVIHVRIRHSGSILVTNNKWMNLVAHYLKKWKPKEKHHWLVIFALENVQPFSCAF